ncbi:homeobox KN domain-containing protein, partial [Blakeslea trispora]
FKPVILFHDYSYSTDASGVTHHIHIPYGDPYYSPLIQQKKQTVGTMLKSNGKAWYEIIQNTRQELETEEHPLKSSIPSVDNHIMIRKRRGNLPKTVTAVLKQWLVEHCRNPYPIEAEKTSLKDKTGLTLNQISNWFINARRRLLPQIL